MSETTLSAKPTIDLSGNPAPIRETFLMNPETRVEAPDPFLEVLPLLLADHEPQQQEPSFDQLDEATRARYQQLMEQRDRLAQEGRLPTGTDVAIFVSHVGTARNPTRVVDDAGNEQFFYRYLVSEKETAEHMAAAESISHRIKIVTADTVHTTIQIASKEAIDHSLFDSNVAHIIFIGHTSGAKLALEPAMDYTWADPQQELDHLKLSFGVFGCGYQKPDSPQPRVGFSLVAPGGILYGIGQDSFEQGTPYDFGELVQLPNQPLEGAPSSQVKAHL